MAHFFEYIPEALALHRQPGYAGALTMSARTNFWGRLAQSRCSSCEALPVGCPTAHRTVTRALWTRSAGNDTS